MMVMEIDILPAPDENTSWTVARAKAHLSEVIEGAQSSPQIITRNGKPSVVAVSAEEWQRKTERKGTLAQFLLDSPLLDTNILSEVTKSAPRASARTWLDTLDEDRTFINVISIAEIRRGVVLLDEGRRRDTLNGWLLHDLPERFGQRILPVDEPVALTWGDLMGLPRHQGCGLSAMDRLIAATALANDLVLATRNMRNFESLGIELFDPWSISA